MAQILPAAAFLVLATTVHAQNAPAGFTIDAYGGSLSNGTTMAWSPDGRLFVGTLDGSVRVIKGGVLLDMPFHQATVDNPADTVRGLLGMCLDPGFASNGYVYIYFTNPSPASHNCIRRLQPSSPGGDVSDGSETAILDLENLGSDTMHNGGCIQFAVDGKLYVAVGDNAVSEFAQSLTSRLGKILRYNADGSIPGDNPSSFAGISGSPMGEFRSIWAVGLRNPFRFALQPGTNRIFINDVGADTWEEIDDGAPGRNYGWVGGDTDGARGMAPYTDPIFQYGHSGTVPMGKAITGGVFYNPSSAQFPSSYLGLYFFSDYATGFIDTLDPATGGVAEFVTGASGPVDLQLGPDGALYYLVDKGSQGVYRVSYVARANEIGSTSGVQQSGDSSNNGKCGISGFEPLVPLALLRFVQRRRRESLAA
jgi:glucose/arabinose dehydrogenase